MQVLDKVRATVGATTGGLALVAYQLLRDRDVASGVAVVIAVASAFAAALAIDALLFGYGLRFKWARRLLLKTGKYEGLWFVEHHDLQQHSLATIASDGGSIIYQGIGVDPATERECVVWRSNDTAFSSDSGTFWYTFEARVSGKTYGFQGDESPSSKTMRGFGTLVFNEDIGGKPYSGVDSYIDIDDDGHTGEPMYAIEHWGRMHRIEPKEIRAAIGRRSPRSDQDRLKVLQKSAAVHCTCEGLAD